MGDWPLYPMGSGCFFDFQTYGEMCFSRNAGGKELLRWKTPTFTGEWVKVAVE